MITSLKITNFKSICNETELDLSLLTIFAGENSSGKSALIQTILLIAQTLSSQIPSSSVILNGSFVKLGRFDELKSHDGLSDKISIKFTSKFNDDDQGSEFYTSENDLYYDSNSRHIKQIECSFSFDAGSQASRDNLLQFETMLYESRLSCVYRDDNDDEKVSFISIRRPSNFDEKEKFLDKENELNLNEQYNFFYDVDMDEYSLNEIKKLFPSAEQFRCRLQHFLPLRLFSKINVISEIANSITKILIDGGCLSLKYFPTTEKNFLLPKKVIDILHEILGEIIDFDAIFFEINKQSEKNNPQSMNFTLWSFVKIFYELSDDKRRKIQESARQYENLYERIYRAIIESTIQEESTTKIIYLPLPFMIGTPTYFLISMFRQAIQYLGSLRETPKPIYPFATGAESNIGLCGENTASVLELYKNKTILYIPSAHFSDGFYSNATPVKATLQTAVNDWLQYLQIASSVKIQDQGKLGYEVKVKIPQSDGLHHLTHVGVGVSQVLPILVMCLLARQKKILLLEQPELHLHPKVQTLLGDFFISLALCHKQCIVETHSEYIIDRLRLRIAESQKSLLQNLTKIYFVEKLQGNSVFKEVKINEYGAIVDWPDDFFDQSQKEAEQILITAAKKRIEKRRMRDEWLCESHC